MLRASNCRDAPSSHGAGKTRSSPQSRPVMSMRRRCTKWRASRIRECLAVEGACRNSSSSRPSRRSNAASSPLCGVAVSRIRCRSRSSARRFSSSKRCCRLCACRHRHAPRRPPRGWDKRAQTFATLIGLDVVEADDRVGIGVEQRLRGRQSAFQPRRRSGGDGDGVDIELGVQFAGPLLDQMRRTKHREAVGFAAIDQFAQDQPGLDGLADADIVGDQQPHDRQPQAPSAAARADRRAARSRDGQPTGTGRRRAGVTVAAPRKAAARRPGLPISSGFGNAKRAGRTGSRSSAGWMNCTSASAPESGRRHRISSSGDGSATHSRPRA